MDLREIVNGAALAGAAANFGMEIDELVDFAIKTAQSKGQTVQAVLQKMVESDLDMQQQKLDTLGLDKFENVVRGSEEADNANLLYNFSEEDIEKGRDEGKEDRRLRKAAENIAAESRYRGGYYDDDAPEFEGRRQYRQSTPTDPNIAAGYDPDTDDYVVKKKGRIIRFKQAKDPNGDVIPGDYRPTNQPGGVMKRRMVKYRPGDTQQKYNQQKREFEARNVAPEPFYPGARLEEPFNAKPTGNAGFQDAYQRLDAYINSGAITDPQELSTAMALKEDMKTSLDPGYAKARDFDRGVATVRRDREGLSADEINQRVASDMRAMTADGDTVRPTVNIRGNTQNRTASNEEIRLIREAAIKKSIHRPTEVQPRKGMRDSVDLIGREAELRADYGKKPSAAIRQRNEIEALGRSIINDTEAANFANDRLGNLGEVRIQGSGFKKNGKPDWITEAPVTFENPADFPDAYRQYGPIPQETWNDSSVYFDKQGGNPLAVQGFDILPITANTPDAGQSFNSPESRPVIKDMEDLLIAQQFRTRESGEYPQANISGALNTFNQRIGRVKGIAPDLVGNAGSLADIQNAMNIILGLAADQGTRLNTFGTKERSSNPGPMEVLGKMRYTGPEVQQLGNALLQLELGRTNGVNSLAKSKFFGGTGPYMDNYPIGLGKKGQGRSVDLSAQGPAVSLGRDRMTFGETEQMGDYVVGDYLDTANQRVAPAFRKLTGENIEGSPQERREALADARSPFIGQVKGELVPIDGKKTNPNYRFNATGETDPVKIESAVREQARSRATKKNPRNLTREEQNIYNAQIVNARHYPDVVKMARAGTASRTPIQPTLSRDEYELATAAGGSGMGGGTRPPVAAPSNDSWQERPGTAKGFSNVDYQASLPYGIDTDGPRQRPEGRGFKARAAYASDDFKNYAQNPKYRRGRRIGYGVGGAVAGIAGIDALIGSESERRQEEQY